MALIKLSNNGVKNVSSLSGLTSSVGDLVFISKQTASSSASISFTSGIDSTYKEYVFYLVNIHPQNTDQNFGINFSTDGGSNYNVVKTGTFFRAYHGESGSPATLEYGTGGGLAQGTGLQLIANGVKNDNDSGVSGYVHLFNPSSTTFVKHFISVTNCHNDNVQSMNSFVAGYGNTTSAINGVLFQMPSGNIDSGEILLYGVN